MKVNFLLISEGSSEEPLVLHLESLCLRAGAMEVSGRWVDFGKYPNPPGKKIGAQLKWVMAHFRDYNLVFIHRDADARDDADIRDVITRGVEESELPVACVALVPIQELEAWLLLDESMIRAVAGNPRGRAPLELPGTKQAEERANPKEILQAALSKAEKPGRRRKSFQSMRRTLLERLDLDGEINQLRAWQRLLVDLRQALEAL
ncbi:hypothetical protein G6O69_03915 [Pseudenhygromyxa sp. WMMC2535]|uniref:hypothetical protein n=1 Tax=Pseudenhygromyxa sp. WMMC2535 TaxID=2712867 RepID=UPI0015535BED|nr:hypothetical protein [Pseudenhygromyxa sp. WMMC2535]NVB36962.1 hypothetical protein [Pseudenhygromyxa sp. WMMC2535]